jgi:hypothetical protein
MVVLITMSIFNSSSMPSLVSKIRLGIGKAKQFLELVAKTKEDRAKSGWPLELSKIRVILFHRITNAASLAMNICARKFPQSLVTDSNAVAKGNRALDCLRTVLLE